MSMSKRAALKGLIGGIGLTMVLGVGHAAEGDSPSPDTADDYSSAELVRAEGTIKVNGEEKSVGAALNEGDKLDVAEGGTAVVEFRNGCRYTVEANADYSVSEEQCICFENLDSSKHSKYDAVADLTRIEGKVLVNQGAQYTDATEGMELKEDNLVMALEGSSATIEYYFGCDHTISEDEVYTVDDGSGCCVALALPAPALAVVPSLLPLLPIGGVPFIPDDDDGNGGPPPVISQ